MVEERFMSRSTIDPLVGTIGFGSCLDSRGIRYLALIIWVIS
jgi:hypothetical protein